MQLKLLAVFLLVSFNSFSQTKTRVILEESKKDTITQKLDSILLIGVGSSTTRIFLDDLSKTISKGFGKDSIACHYYFLGKTTAEAKPAFDTINKQGYKAILFLLPSGTSFYEVQGGLYSSSSTRNFPGITIPFSSIDYKQDFSFALYLPLEHMKKVWEASAQVACDPSKNTIATKLGTKLLLLFKNNKYIH